MRRFVLRSLIAILIIGCVGKSPTTPSGHRATRDCATRSCGTPVIDSISPSIAPLPNSPTFVCIYGDGLEGGTVHFGDSDVASDSPGCGVLVFTAPTSPSGLVSVSVTTLDGTSNVVYFSRE